MKVVVIGAGLAAASAVRELREQGHDGDVTLVGAERHLPYERPPLSKGVLLGKDEPASVFVHDEQWYADQRVALRLGTPVTGIDLDRCHVAVDGDELSYDRLLIATGATPRRLESLEGRGLDVVYLRTLDDATALKERLAGSILVVGAGWIGLEVAAAAREAGADVTVVESAPQPLLNVLGPKLAPVFADLHREHGVDLRLSTSIEKVEQGEVRLSDGRLLRPDLVVVGIGAVPEDGLATRAGLATDNGVLVDAHLRSSDPHVYAAGDVAHHDHPTLGRLRVEHWDNAIHQGRHAARVMLGEDQPYTRLPYFFTDQYDLGMEYVGYVGADGYDDVVVSGDQEKRVLTAFWVRDGQVVAGLHLNDWDAIERIRQIVGGDAAALR